MAAIPDRIWELMTDEERELCQSVVDGWRFEPRVQCPSCGCHIGVRLKVTAGAARIDEETGEVIKAAAVAELTEDDGLSPSERRLLADAEHDGLLAGFSNAVIEEKAGQVPADLRRFLILYLRTAKETAVPREVLDVYRSELGDRGYLKFFSAQGIYAVTVDGQLRGFFPKTRFAGSAVRAAQPGRAGIAIRVSGRMEEWVRGRFGYVPAGSGLFADVINERSVGAFGRLVQ